MRIAIIGAGNVGVALGIGWGRAGHEILFGVSDPAKDRYRQATHGIASASLHTVADAAHAGEVVALAVPWTSIEDALRTCGPLAGKTILDATNPLVFTNGELQLAIGFDTSGAEQIAALAPDAAVVKAMNQVGYAVMANAGGYPTQPVMFVAGDDPAAKATVLSLVGDLGFEAIDAGPLRIARLLEPYAMLWIDQAVARGTPPTNAFAFMRKG